MIRIGILGDIGSGKSFIAKQFDCPVFDADQEVSKIYKKDINYFRNLNFFVVDCLRYKHHPSHFNLKDVLNLIKIIKPKKTILTNLNNELDYNELRKKLPKFVVPAYDGMSFSI